MELWIRSQDKNSLTKVSNLSLQEIKHPVRHDTEYWGIGTYYDNLQMLGKYTTKERALEVLNDIQKTMHLKDMYINDRQEVLKAWTKFTEEQIGDIRTKMSVYEMPQE